jgi:serine/threonine-protein kinase
VKLGTIIAGKYRLERVIGRGAMGVVLEASDLALGRRIAVKLILAQHAADPQLRGRFVREAHVMTRLATPHIAKVYDVGELEDGTLFLAMEFLEGQSLEQLVSSGGPLPVADAVDLILEALDAVTEAHELGLVHRDLKPANLFLTARKGRPPILKVIDFGIVKDTTSAAKLTASGTLPGTPAYMAPEQVALQGDLIDARADVWAIGVTLYELLTGELPFAGPMNVMLARIRQENPPRLRAVRPDVSPDLEAIVMRCLAKRPADRYANGAELTHALHELRERGNVRSDRGDRRQEVATEISVAKRAEIEREAATTEVDPLGRRPRNIGLAVLVALVALVLVVGLILATQGRLRGTQAPPASSSTTLTSTSVAPPPRVESSPGTRSSAIPSARKPANSSAPR